MINVDTVLKEGELVVTGRLVDASNATLLAHSSLNGTSVKCIYKPVAGERPLWDFPDGNLANREYAAYVISEALGFHIVPLTILRDGPFGMGMVQEWIEIDSDVDLANFFGSDHSQLRAMALFDAVINNTDRKIGHLLPRSDGKVFGCDHGVTFHKEFKLRTVLWQWAGDSISSEEKRVLQGLLAKLEGQELQFLTELITTEEYEALIWRIKKLISDNSFPTPSPDWPAIPWPAF
jgi:hypothetical protein